MHLLFEYGQTRLITKVVLKPGTDRLITLAMILVSTSENWILSSNLSASAPRSILEPGIPCGSGCCPGFKQ